MPIAMVCPLRSPRVYELLGAEDFICALRSASLSGSDGLRTRSIFIITNFGRKTAALSVYRFALLLVELR